MNLPLLFITKGTQDGNLLRIGVRGTLHRTLVAMHSSCGVTILLGKFPLPRRSLHVTCRSVHLDYKTLVRRHVLSRSQSFPSQASIFNPHSPLNFPHFPHIPHFTPILPRDAPRDQARPFLQSFPSALSHLSIPSASVLMEPTAKRQQVANGTVPTSHGSLPSLSSHHISKINATQNIVTRNALGPAHS